MKTSLTQFPSCDKLTGKCSNVAFDFYLSSRMTINIVPAYAAELRSTSMGTSSSAGILQVQDRNTYTVPLETSAGTVVKSLQFTEFNNLEHDTNEEPLPPPVSPLPYQNWAQFGAAVSYNALYDANRHIILRVQYSYDAFNAAYEAHTVVASVNVDF